VERSFFRALFIKERVRVDPDREIGSLLYTASLITTKHVIPAKAGIQKNTGFRVKPGMTDR
jgi:hypothetical protein